MTVDSPSDGAALRVPWVPLVVPVDSSEDGAAVTVCVDGAPVADPLTIVRRRSGVAGGGWDVLGSLELTALAPGAHTLEVLVETVDGRLLKGESAFTHDRAAHRVDLVVTDAEGAPTSARVVITDGVAPVSLGSPDGEAADPYGRDADLHSVFVVNGAATVWLDPGHYRLLAVRGVREHLGVAELDLDDDRVVTLEVASAVALDDHLSADLHVHTGRSYDSFVPDRYRYASLIAAGVEVAVITDHNRVVDPDPALAVVGGPDRGGIRGVAGVEADIRAQGELSGGHWDIAHLNAFPVVGPEVVALPTLQPPSVASTLDDFRARQVAFPHPDAGERVLLQLNHPRGIHFRPEDDPVYGAWPIFDELGFDPRTPVGEGGNAWMTEPEPGTGTIALDFDAMEIVNRFSLELYDTVRADWFALLNQGFFVTGTGNADSHALQVEVAGFPTNLVQAPRPGEGERLDAGAFVEAVQDGRVIVTTGAVPQLTLSDGVGAAGPGELLLAEGAVTAEIRLRAAPWVPVDELRLVVNGDVVRTLAPSAAEGEALDVAVSWPVEAPGDAWVLVEAGWPLYAGGVQPRVGGDYGLVAPGYVPLGFTNPVFVDLDGDGVWTPPGL
ncbi:MAG: PHP domain-containing protein [Alphaproteobacteria bacterium]|nr:PHP domain-containing protein [Alphaproteobacteria bacterium]